MCRWRVAKWGKALEIRRAWRELMCGGSADFQPNVRGGERLPRRGGTGHWIRWLALSVRVGSGQFIGPGPAHPAQSHAGAGFRRPVILNPPPLMVISMDGGGHQRGGVPINSGSITSFDLRQNFATFWVAWSAGAFLDPP